MSGPVEATVDFVTSNWMSGIGQSFCSGRLRIRRRAMIMEYIYFVFSIAAVGMGLALLWRIGNAILSGQQTDLPGRERIPPTKKTISGLSQIELDQIELQGRIDAWQTAHEVRRDQFKKAAEPVSGRKYEYIPPPKNRAATSRRKEQVLQLGRRFELLN